MMASCDESTIRASLFWCSTEFAVFARIQLGMSSAQLLLDALAIADVANRAEHQHSGIRVYGREADFDREFGTILATAAEIQRGTHAPGLRLRVEALTMMVVLAAVGDRDQHLDLLADQFALWVPEELFGLRVDLDDHAFGIDGHHRVGNGFKKACRQKGLGHALGKLRQLFLQRRNRRMASACLLPTIPSTIRKTQGAAQPARIATPLR